MKKVYSKSGMKALEQNTIDNIGVDALVLMERAAIYAFGEITNLFPAKNTDITIVCGTGNNGGDGLAVARLLIEAGYNPKIYIHYGHSVTQAFEYQKNILANMNACFINDFDNSTYLCIDALIGIGFNNKCDDETEELINKINSFSDYIVSLDIPSGLNASTGIAPGNVVYADYTITFGAYKVGLFFNDGLKTSGKIMMNPIGIIDSPNLNFDYLILDDEDVYKSIPKRDVTGNKSTFGKLLIIAGSESMGGCALLASRAAFYAGSGMVKTVTHKNNAYLIQSVLPETMLTLYDNDEIDIEGDLSWCDAVAIGPGISNSAISKSLLCQAVSSGKPLVIDADAINIIASDKEVFDLFIENCDNSSFPFVITPHKGEKERLLNAYNQSMTDHVYDLCSFSSETNTIMVDKGSKTKIYGKDYYINPTGNDGMATAGSGDVLTGILGSMVASLAKSKENTDPTRMIAVGVYLHGLLGDYVLQKESRESVTASKMVDSIGIVLNNIYGKED